MTEGRPVSPSLPSPEHTPKASTGPAFSADASNKPFPRCVGGDINEALRLQRSLYSQAEQRWPYFVLDSASPKLECPGNRRGGRRQDQKNSPPPVTSKEHPTREPEPEGQQLQRARSVQAGAGGPVAQGRAGKEGAGHRGESIKGVIQPVLSSEAPRARPGRLEKKVAPGRGETNCCNLCRSGSRFLIYSLPLFFFLLPKTSSSPPFFCFVFESRQLSGKGEKAFFLPFSFPRLFPSPSFLSSSLFLPTPGDLSRWPPGRGLSA